MDQFEALIIGINEGANRVECKLHHGPGQASISVACEGSHLGNN